MEIKGSTSIMFFAYGLKRVPVSWRRHHHHSASISGLVPLHLLHARCASCLPALLPPLPRNVICLHDGCGSLSTRHGGDGHTSAPRQCSLNRLAWWRACLLQWGTEEPCRDGWWYDKNSIKGNKGNYFTSSNRLPVRSGRHVCRLSAKKVGHSLSYFL